MAWFDTILSGIRSVFGAGVPTAFRPGLNFTGSVTVTDDPANNRTTVNVTGGGGGSNVPNKPAAAGTIKYYLLEVDTAGTATWVVALQNMIGAAETVALSGGGGGTFECGNTWTVSGLTATPACNSAGVTAATLSDNQGNNDNVFGLGNPLSPSGSPFIETASGSSVTLTLAQTRDGFSLTSNTLVSSWIDRYYVGQGSGGGGTAATSSGNNAALVGDTGTLTGVLASFGVGSTFTVPASLGYTYLWVLHTASAMTFKSGGAPFPMTRVTSSAAYSNQFAVSHGFDLYVSNLLNPPAPMTVTRDT